LWVTKTIAGRWTAQSARTSSASWRRVISSRAAKGSSSSRTFGAVTSARASAARMAIPPESCAGRAAWAPASPTRARASIARARALARGAPASSSGKATLAAALSQGASVGDWNTTAVSPRPAARTARPRVGGSRPARRRSAVDLPQPDGPTRATISPAPRRKSNGPSARPRPG